jgi:hypothetical protein
MPVTTFKTTVKVGDQDQEVEVALPEGVTGYTADEIREGFIPKREFNRRTEKLVGKKAEELLADEEFKGKALQTWGIDLNDQGQRVTGEELERAIKQRETDWTKNVLEPVKAEAERERQRVSNLLNKTLASQIVSAAKEAGVKEELLKAPRPGQPPMIVKALSDVFGFDEETDSFLALDPEDPSEYMLTKTPSANRTYMDVSEFVQDFVESNPGFIGDAPKVQTGPNAKQGNRGKQLSVQEQIAEAEKAGDYARANQLKADSLKR